MEYDEEELNNIVTTTEVPFTTQLPLLNMSSMLINASAVVNTLGTTTTDSNSSSIFPALSNVKFWNKNGKICEMLSQMIHDLTRDLDPFAVVLIIIALTIAIVGIIAIFCQCHMWLKSKRQRHFDTSSWLEYSLDREKLTHNNNQQQNSKLQRQIENKKFISKLFQSSLLPPVPALVDHKSGFHYSSQSGGKPFSLNDSQLYLGSPSKQHFTVDIDQCQLVQSFMKHSETGKQYMDNKKKNKKEKEKEKVVKEQKVKKNKAPKKPSEGKGRAITNRVKSAARKSGSSDTLPFFAATSSLSSSSKLSDRGNQRSSAVPPAALQKEYETQTLELNLTGSDDGDSQTNVSILEDDNKIYERIISYPRSDMAIVNSNGGLHCKAPNKVAPTGGQIKSSISQLNSQTLNKQANVNAHSNGRVRQLVPPSNISEAVARANHSRSVLANKVATGHHKLPYYAPPSVAGTLAKNPLYSEISEHEESIIFSDASHPATSQSVLNGSSAAANKATIGGFALENESRLYAQLQPPMNRQLTYSTFIKPLSPRFR